MDAIKEIKEEGVIVLENWIAPETILVMALEIQKIRARLTETIDTMSRPLRTYSDIAERHLGRLDFRCGFSADIFELMAKPIIKLIHELSATITFRHYWGAIPSAGGAGPTNMHRDVYPILNTTEGVNLSALDLGLPPYYFTVLIPLMPITRENGPTEFIKGSHRKPVVDVSQSEIYAPLLSAGDMVIFDGRTLHRGAANNTAHEREIAYITFVANWYHDQTFEINDYLFPDLL